MTVRLSTGLRNAMAGFIGFGGAFASGSINIYSGTQPATGDAAVTGTLLGTITNASGALTQEVRAAGSVTITAAAGGSIDAITVGGLNIIPSGAVAATAGDTAATASSLCDAINANGIMEASLSASTVTIKGRPGTGVTTAAVAGTLTTVTATYVAMGTGVAGTAPVNGLKFNVSAAGVISKKTGQIWSFNGVAVGTAGWFRLIASASDAGALISAAPYPCRLDGSVAVSGADLNLSNISIAISAPCTVDTFNFTIPAA
jgi:hypothetical protein